MPRYVCCVSGCPVVADEGIPLHYFPNPEKDAERFQSWVKNIGGDIKSLNSAIIYKTRRICRRHFQKEFLYPKNRLCKLAVPSLFLSSEDLSAPTACPLVPEYQPQEAALLKPIVIPSCSSAPTMNPLVSRDPTSLHPKPKKPVEYSSSVTFLQQTYEKNELKKLELKLHHALKAKNTYRNRYLLARKVSKTNAYKIVAEKMSPAARTLFLMQVKGSGIKPRGRRFTLNEKILALSLYKPSPKAYRLLSQVCTLPSRRTLQNVLQTVDLKPGINEEIFADLQKKVSKMPEKHKYCSLLFDEMSIASNISYNKTHDNINGFVDNGSKRELIFSDHVLVFMLRGIVKKYKQPIAYTFCSGTTKTVDLKSQLKNIIEKVQSTGLQIVATICDQGATNLAAINQLLEETKGKYLRNNEDYNGGFFEVGNARIVPLYDPPHLLKGVRNNLLSKNLKFEMDGRVRLAKWCHIEDLFQREPSYRGVKLLHKLTAEHVVPSMIPKMKVKHCTQVFSKSVGAILGSMAENGSMPAECMDTADLLLLFDKLFDSVNANKFDKEEGKIYKSPVTRNSPHLKFWNETLPVLKSMKYINKNGRESTVPSLSSWVKTIEGFKTITKMLLSKGIHAVLLRNLNQDPLENFFGAIRSHGYSNIMPNSAAFETAFKTLLINSITSPNSPQANCEKDDSICLKSLKSFLKVNINKKKEAAEDGQEIMEIEDEHLNIEIINTQNMLESSSRVHVEKCAAVAYCSGWIAIKGKKKVFKNCKSCKNNLISKGNENFHNFIVKKEYNGKRWLCYPSRALFDFFAQVEHITMEVLKNNAHKDKICEYIRLIASIYVDLNFIKCKKHKNILKKYLLHKSVEFFTMTWCKQVSNVLTGKSYINLINLHNSDQIDRIFLQAREHFNKTKGRKRERQTAVFN